MADYLWILPIALLALLMKRGSSADGSGGGWLAGDWFGGSDCDAGDGGDWAGTSATARRGFSYRASGVVSLVAWHTTMPAPALNA